MKIPDAASNALVVVAICCGVLSTALMVRREFGGPLPTDRPIPSPSRVANWEQYAKVGHRIGSKDAPVTIIEFADFECPACRRFEATLAAMRAKYKSDVAVVFRQWPLPYHRFAFSSAQAAACAAQQGRFEPMHDLLYAKQDSLGVKPFDSFAADVGVPSLGDFTACQKDSTVAAEIRADEAAAKSLNARGTPTVIVNGLQFASVPDEQTLDAAVKAALHHSGR